MAPRSLPFKKGSKEAAKYGGAGGLLNFFPKKEKPKKKAGRPWQTRGRPSKSKQPCKMVEVRVVVTGRGHCWRPLEATVPAEFLPATDPAAVLAESATGETGEQASLKSPPEDIVPAVRHKKHRINWGKGEARAKMSRAVEDWFGEKGSRFDENGELIMDRTIYACRVNTPRDSLYRYIHPDSTKR